jgi:hypothetical protein
VKEAVGSKTNYSQPLCSLLPLSAQGSPSATFFDFFFFLRLPVEYETTIVIFRLSLEIQRWRLDPVNN